MLNSLTKLLVRATFSLMLLAVALGFLANSGAFRTLDGLGIHIGISDIIHPDNLVDRSFQNFEQNLNAQININ